MRKTRICIFLLIATMAVGAGCQSRKAGRAKPRYHTVENSFTDQAARSDYIERRTGELADKGINRDKASARASREWFAQAPVAREVPTSYELNRRAAEADITAYLEKQKEAGGR